MRRFPLLFCLLALAACQPKVVRINTPQGTLCLEPIAEDAIRVRMTPEGAPELGELIFTEKVKAPKYTVERNGGDVIVRTAKMSAVWYSEAQALSFLDADDNLLLRENGHSVAPAEVQGELAWAASARFDSPAGEHLYGTGQFQDGYLDIRGLTRRLTQVNTQIALPMVLSSRGWGLLWHNYGLTDFNPADHSLALTEAKQDGGSVTVNATGTAGNRREMRFFRTFTGEIELPEDGEYALLLDVGRDMARRQYLAIDGEPVIDISNTWLPPTAAVKAQLSAGRHRLVVQGTFGDAPVVYWRAVTDETVFSSPVASGLDYVVFAGDADAVMHSFRSLAGHVPALPDWIFRYIHCRERFDTQDELLTVARRLHAEQIPVGTVVQDWQWWGKYGWNAMQFDEDKYPDPKAMTDELHAMDQHLMLSVWSRIGRDSELGKEVEAQGYYIEGTEWVDFFQPDAAAFYWKNFSEKLLPVGIDAWWQQRLPGHPALRRRDLERRRRQRLGRAAPPARGRPGPDGRRPALVDLRRRRLLPPRRPIYRSRLPGTHDPLDPGRRVAALHARTRLPEPHRAVGIQPRNGAPVQGRRRPARGAAAVHYGAGRARLGGGLHPDAPARLRLPAGRSGAAAELRMDVRPGLPRLPGHGRRRRHLDGLPAGE